jgi:ABC-type amino acid transport substrate-binding protein
MSRRDFIMWRIFYLLLIATLLAGGPPAMAGDVAPGGTLRAAYLGTNPAQAMRDPATGELRGPAYDLARELARRDHAGLEFKPIAGPPAVIEAVKTGNADIGFVATRRRGSGRWNSPRLTCWCGRAFSSSTARPSRRSPISTAPDRRSAAP